MQRKGVVEETLFPRRILGYTCPGIHIYVCVSVQVCGDKMKKQGRSKGAIFTTVLDGISPAACQNRESREQPYDFTFEIASRFAEGFTNIGLQRIEGEI